MFKFILKVRHDKGVDKISTHARNAEAAKEMVKSAFNCPNSAIIDVRSVNDAGFELATAGDNAGRLVRLSVSAPAIVRDHATPRNPYANGYGKKIPTAYRVRTIDGKLRRVYVAQFSNGGTTYVMHDGIKTAIDIERLADR